MHRHPFDGRVTLVARANLSPSKHLGSSSQVNFVKSRQSKYTQALLSALGSELGRCLFLPRFSLTIIPRMRVGHEMVDSQRCAKRRVSWL